MLGPKPCKEPVLGHDENEGKEHIQGYVGLGIVMFLIAKPKEGEKAYHSKSIASEE